MNWGRPSGQLVNWLAGQNENPDTNTTIDIAIAMVQSMEESERAFLLWPAGQFDQFDQFDQFVKTVARHG